MAAKNKHLTATDRSFIESELDQSKNFKQIGEMLGKDGTTISKEVKAHIQKKKTGSMGVGFNDCVLCVEHACRLKSVCSKCFSTSKRLCWTCGKCRASCDKYVSYHCPDLSKAPYVCNGCKKKHNCSLEKSVYCASLAQKEYEKPCQNPGPALPSPGKNWHAWTALCLLFEKRT